MSVAPAIRALVRRPVRSIGAEASFSPWTMRVGTWIFRSSSRMSTWVFSLNVFSSTRSGVSTIILVVPGWAAHRGGSRRRDRGCRPGPCARSWPGRGSRMCQLRRRSYTPAVTGGGRERRPARRPARVTNPGIPSLRITVQALRSGPEHHSTGLSVIPDVTTGRKTTAPGSAGTNREVPRLAVRGGTEPRPALPSRVTAAKTAGDQAGPVRSVLHGRDLAPGSFIYGPQLIHTRRWLPD